MEKEIGEIQKNSREVIKVRYVEFNGMNLLDMRVIATNKPGMPPIMTKKGLCINPDLLPELIDLLKKAEAVRGNNE